MRRTEYRYQQSNYNQLQPKQRRFKFAYFLPLLLLVSLFTSPAATNATTEPITNSTQNLSELFNKTVSYITPKVNASIVPVYSKAYLLVNADTGEIITGENQNLVLPIASTTKMVTALVARELFSPDEIVTISDWVPRINGSKINLQEGEQITVKDLLKGLLIQSGNDTAFALAEHYSKEAGNYQLFVEQMNNYVKRHDFTSTIYGDPAGLDDEVGRSSAAELAQIGRLVLADDLLKEIVSTGRTTVSATNSSLSHDLLNTNRLILNDSSFYLPNAYGIKTGFTPDAGHCLVAAYDSSAGTVIGVVLHTNQFGILESAREMRKLFVWADQNLVKKNY